MGDEPVDPLFIAGINDQGLGVEHVAMRLFVTFVLFPFMLLLFGLFTLILNRPGKKDARGIHAGSKTTCCAPLTMSQ